MWTYVELNDWHMAHHMAQIPAHLVNQDRLCGAHVGRLKHVWQTTCTRINELLVNAALWVGILIRWRALRCPWKRWQCCTRLHMMRQRSGLHLGGRCT